MNPNDQETISNIFCEVLETIAFMFGEPIEKDELESIPEDCLVSEMKYSGDKTGTLTMIVQTEMCLEISASVLGKDFNEALQMVKATDSVKELLNITCGRLLTEFFGEEPVFDLSVPEILDPDENYITRFLEDPEMMLFSVDDWIVMLKWSVDS